MEKTYKKEGAKKWSRVRVYISCLKTVSKIINAAKFSYRPKFQSLFVKDVKPLEISIFSIVFLVMGYGL
jgi:hypothetical protein